MEYSNLSALQLDALKEVSNIGAGNAATALSMMIGKKVDMTVPAVNVGDKTIGLLVDSLLGQQEIVIKPLGKTLKSLDQYIGATILGNGLVTLILDVGALL